MEVAAAQLSPARDLGVPALDDAIAAWEEQGRETGVFPFTGPLGARWWAGLSELKLDNRNSVWSAVLVPRSDLLGNVVNLRNLTIGGILLLGVLTAAVFLVTAMRSIRRQMKDAVDRIEQRLGQYHVEEKIGEGGNGTVYRARHALLRRPTAMKLMNPVFARSDAARKRFEHEVRLTSSLSHPNTVSIYDFGRTSDGTLYYAMELLEGGTLDRVVQISGPLPPGRVIHFLEQACGSLAEAHSRGLIHRDIKPSNLIVCERGGLCDVIKVVDFGLVKEIAATDGNVTQGDVLVGTPFFMAPETITEAGQAGPKSDIYSLGAVGYYLLAGRHVFEGESAVEICSAHLHD
ncbi:MAG: serine/threonine-protein kinase, partial [Gammaproteobacteria bacterium]